MPVQNLTLLHGSIEPIFFGIVMFLSIALFLWRWNRKQYLHAVGMVAAYFFLMTLHRSHSMAISMAMAIAVILVDVCLPLLVKSKKK